MVDEDYVDKLCESMAELFKSVYLDGAAKIVKDDGRTKITVYKVGDVIRIDIKNLL
jgi:hypothetical protein